MLRILYYPGGDSGDVRDYLESLRRDQRTIKAAVKLFLDIKQLGIFWPNLAGVTVRSMKGWEPLRELKRHYDKVGYRIFFCIRKDELWLLSAYEKESQHAPRRELERAFYRMKSIIGDKS